MVRNPNIAHPEPVRCPSCKAPISGAPAKCPECGMALWLLDWKYGVRPRHWWGISDLGRCMDKGEHVKLRRLFRKITRSLPQVVPVVVITPSSPGNNLEEYAFWLINRGGFAPPGQVKGRNFTLLLLIDPARTKAVLMTGYGLEPWLSHHELQTVLHGGRDWLANGKWAAGCLAIMNRAHRMLLKKVTSKVPRSKTSVARKQDEPLSQASFSEASPEF